MKKDRTDGTRPECGQRELAPDAHRAGRRSATSTTASDEQLMWRLDAGATPEPSTAEPTAPVEDAEDELEIGGTGWRDKRIPEPDTCESAPQADEDAFPAGAEIPEPDDRRTGPISFDELTRLPLIDYYEAAFRKATGVAMKVVPPLEPLRPMSLGQAQNPFCALVANLPHGCEICRNLHARAQRNSPKNQIPQQISCFAGLTDVAVPVMVGDQHVATLFSGQVFRREPTERDFGMILAMLGSAGDRDCENKLRAAYFATPVVTADRFQAVVQLLRVFAQYLADSAGRSLLTRAEGEPAAVTHARRYIREHLQETITLDDVVSHVGVSRFYFCRLFRKAAGMTLTEYISRVRVEHAKKLLENPSFRISEVVYAAGFGSIPHFNTIFKRYAGKSPTEFRESLRSALV